MAPPRNYRREYLRRTRAGIPRSVARGHGPLPANIARALERNQLPEAERERYGPEIQRYEARYGPSGTGHAGRMRRIPRTFDSPEQAMAWLEGMGYYISGESLRFTESGGRWRVTILR